MSDYSTLLCNYRSFLTTHAPIFNNEVVNTYPSSLTNYDPDWIKTIASLPLSTLYQVAVRGEHTLIPHQAFQQFLEECSQLKGFLKWKRAESAEREATDTGSWIGITAKKQHELRELLPIIETLCKRRGLKTVLDLGGGVGHTSYLVKNGLQLECKVLEANSDFIDIGLKRATHRRYPLSPPEFIHHTFTDKSFEVLQNHLTQETLLFGLHSCGNLSVLLLKLLSEHQLDSVINFGCCYSKLSQECLNISAEASTAPLFLSNYALTLASRSHSETTEVEFLYQVKVKSYRAALHFLLESDFGHDQFITVGDSPKSTYASSFEAYANLKLTQLGITPLKESYLQHFYKRTENKIREIVAANIIRWQLGRIIEIYILLDRACYLTEAGYSVNLKGYFDEAISPRNLGIIASRK